MTAEFFLWIKTKICAIYIIVENISSNMRIEILCSLVANIVQNRVHMYVYFFQVYLCTKWIWMTETLTMFTKTSIIYVVLYTGAVQSYIHVCKYYGYELK